MVESGGVAARNGGSGNSSWGQRKPGSMEGGVVAVAQKGVSYEKIFGGKNFSNCSHDDTNNRPRQRPTSLSNSPTTPTVPTAPTALTAPTAPRGRVKGGGNKKQMEKGEDENKKWRKIGRRGERGRIVSAQGGL